MNRTVLTVLKAIAGLLVLFVLAYTVSNWWQEYRSQAAKPRPSSDTVAGKAGADEPLQAAKPGATVVVLVDGVNLREEPSTGAKSLADLDKGEKVTLVKLDGQWYEVKTAKGSTGWISANPSDVRIESP